MSKSQYDREDVLIREDHTFSPISIYVDMSPEAAGSFVSDVYRVWEHLDDVPTIRQARELLEVYSIDPEFVGREVGVYSNLTEQFIHNHPVFKI